MTPKEEANRLVKKYMYMMGYYYETDAKKYALDTVEEIINAIYWQEFEVLNNQLEHWLDVQKEIQKL